MNRRKFLEAMSLTLVAAAMPYELVRAAEKDLVSGPEVKVSLAGVTQGVSERELLAAVREAAESATDFSWLSRGESVLIKPVVNSGNPYPATTSPAGLKAMITLLRETGAKRIVVSDMSGIEHVKLSPDKMRGSTRELMQSCGVARVAEEGGSELYLPEEQGWAAFFEDSPAPGSSWKSGIMMPKILREVDHVVLLPRCSRHALAGATLGMKAAVGYWRTDSRLEYHHDAATFHEKTAEANTVASLREKQRLTLTVADKVQATFGPDKGYVVAPKTGLIFASESLIAHDMISLAWLLQSRKMVPEEHKRGLRDPYSSQFIVNVANRWVVKLLGGVSRAVGAETLLRKNLETIWDDPTLRRAFQLFDGVPQLHFIEANSGVPADLKRRLATMTTIPAIGVSP
ncbi:MAG: DUF362 domain-containing protein [Deltaproteobacteria bacterium]|nr:MAG: DUF362 domain-containing protein [Deltaproteobacteria bacterium]